MEILNIFFASVFTVRNSSEEFQVLKIVWGEEDFLLVEEDLIRDLLGK